MTGAVLLVDGGCSLYPMDEAKGEWRVLVWRMGAWHP